MPSFGESEKVSWLCDVITQQDVIKRLPLSENPPSLLPDLPPIAIQETHLLKWMEEQCDNRKNLFYARMSMCVDAHITNVALL